MSERRFLAIITDFSKFRLRLPMRSFRHADAARDWVDDIHGLLCEDGDKGISDDYVESAYLYRIRKDGSCVQIDAFSGLDRGDGLRSGWEQACDWRNDHNHGCSRSRVKGKTVCAFHAKESRYCSAPEGLFAGTNDNALSESALRKDLKDKDRSATLLTLLRLAS